MPIIKAMHLQIEIKLPFKAGLGVAESQRNCLPPNLSNIGKAYLHFSFPGRVKGAFMLQEIKD